MKSNKNILIISLGSTPDVFRSTIESFKKDLPEIDFERIVIVCNTNLRKGIAKKQLESAIENAAINKKKIKRVFSQNDDLMTKTDNLEFFRMVFAELEKAKIGGFKVFVNIAGGRKQMSALLLTAAYLSGCEKIYHTFYEKRPISENQTDIDKFEEKIGLIEIPHLQLSKLLESVIREIDIDNRFEGSVAELIRQIETEEAFRLLNEYLEKQNRYKILKEEYADKQSFYKLMIQSCRMIVENILKNQLMFQPEYQSRIKEFDSFYKKILKKEENEGTITKPFERFSDFAGLRVIFYNSEDLEKAVRLVEESEDFVNFSDGAKLKGDDKSETYGYRAVHLDAKLNPEKRGHLQEYSNLKDIACEMQFTTVFAYAWSKTHHALSYKDERDIVLSKEEQNDLNNAFTVAAKNLKQIEDDITALTKAFYPKKKTR